VLLQLDTGALQLAMRESWWRRLRAGHRGDHLVRIRRCLSYGSANRDRRSLAGKAATTGGRSVLAQVRRRQADWTAVVRRSLVAVWTE
jgi:hypothetical protein